jgi:hypothetical protein
MALIPTTFDISGLGAYDVSKLRGDYLRRAPRYPGGAYEGDADGSELMNAVAPTVYAFGPDDVGERWVLLGFDAVVCDVTSAVFNAIRFGQGAALANGLFFQVARLSTGVTQTFARIQANADWFSLCGKDAQYVSLPNLDYMFARKRFNDTHRCILDGTQGDVFQVLVNDSLQQMPHVSVYAWAYKL